jgi:hypothetical protein
MSKSYGYISHHSAGYWLEGPLPSPSCARKLIRMNQCIDYDTVTSSDRLSIIRKWKLVDPDNTRVEWAIDLLAPAHLVPPVVVAATLRVLEQRLHVMHDTGPLFDEPEVENWAGDHC